MSDSPAAILHNTSGTEVATAANPLRVDPTGATTQPVSDGGGSITVDATSLPLPTGAATAAKQPALGTAGTPSADVISVQGVSGGTPQPVSGTVTANAGTGPFPVSDNGGSLTVDGSVTVTQATGTNLHTVVDAATIAALTDGTQKAINRGGAKGATTAADITSTAEGTDHQALDIQIYHGGTAKDPTAVRALTSSDVVTVVQTTGTSLHTVVDSGAVTASQATAANLNATVVQATGTNLHTVVDAATIAALTDGTQKAIARGGAKGATTATDVTSTAEGTDHQALDIQIYHGGTAKDPTAIRALTSSDVVTAAQATAANLNATVVQATGSNLHTVVDSGSVTVTQATGTNLHTVVDSGTVTVAQATASSLNATVVQATGTNLHTVVDAATIAALTDGTQKAINRGGAKGATTAADVTSTAEGTDHQSLDVQIYHGGTAKDPTAIRALTSSDVVTAAQSTAANLNATVVGAGTAGTPSGGVVSVQGVVSGTAIPVSASALPLPSGAATAALQTTGNTSLGNIDTKLPASVGQKAMAASLPVVVASDQGAIAVSAASLPLPTGAATAALQTTGNTSLSNLDTKTPSLGQALMASSSPVVIASNQSAVPVSVSALPLPTGAATETTLSGMSGKLPATLGQKAMAASVSVAIASDQGAIPITGSITASNPSVGTDASTKPTSDTLIGGSDGTNVQAVRVFDADSGAGSQYVLGVQLRGSSSGGSVEVGNATNPLYTSAPQSVLSASNSTTTNLASWASFQGTTLATTGIAVIHVNLYSDQPMKLVLQQSSDGTNWDIVDDQHLFQSGLPEAFSFKVMAAYARVVLTNVGYTTTTALRMQTLLCASEEPLPHALTPNGNLRLASMTNSWAPNFRESQDWTQHRALLMDVDRSLRTRGSVFTDAASFRDDFTASDAYDDLTGTCYFVNGQDIVVGNGTAFTTELDKQRYLKLSTHADTAYVLVSEILSNNLLRLDSAYTGATASGTGRCSRWVYTTTGTGAAITQTTSEVLLASGTASGNICSAVRFGDYMPIVVGFTARMTQRIANQTAYVGLLDNVLASANAQAVVIFDGTTNTTVKFQTAWSLSDIQTTTVTLPDGLTTAASAGAGAYYQIELTPNRASLYINDVLMATHRLHIPGPYSPLDLRMAITNAAVVTTTTLAVDTIFFTNYDRVEVSNSSRGDAVSTREIRASKATTANVTAAAADTTVLASNMSRLGATIYNDSTATLYLKLGSGASTTSFTVMLNRYDYYEVPFGYTGRINGYWATATGSARVTEVT